jgi:hypothetical protein
MERDVMVRVADWRRDRDDLAAAFRLGCCNRGRNLLPILCSET